MIANAMNRLAFCLFGFQGSSLVRASAAGAAMLLATQLPAEEQKPAEPAKPKITYVDHVLPLLRTRCGSCHNANDRRGGLVVDSYGSLMEGGSSGTVIEAGDIESSYLWSLITHQDSPKMPPNADKLPEAELNLIQQWIQGGALENSGSIAAVKKQPTLTKIDVSNARPAEVAVPQKYLGEPVELPSGRNAVTALASSPWASLVAISGFKQVALYDAATLTPLGTLPFPEGQAQTLKFSRNGDLLLAGGGRGGSSGRVVVFDVRTGERRIEVGDEYDEILGADISSDHTLVALGGPKRILRVYDTATGEEKFHSSKHTDWITAVEFSPDGVLIASGDRSQGLIVWEAQTGQIYQDFPGHKGAITALSWRPDSNVLASASEDGSIKLWDMQSGNTLKSWDAHKDGVTSVAFTRDGEIISTGRDKVTRRWAGDGKKIKDYPAVAELPLEVAYDAEAKRVLVGDLAGMITLWQADSAAPCGQLETNPRPVAEALQGLQPQLDAAAAIVAAKQAAVSEAEKPMAERQAKLEQAKARQQELQAAVTAAKSQQAELVAKKQTVQDQLPSVAESKAMAQGRLTAVQSRLKQAEQRLESLKKIEREAQAQQEQATRVHQESVTALKQARELAEAAQAAAKPTDAEQSVRENDERIQADLAKRQKFAETAVDVVKQSTAVEQQSQVRLKAASQLVKETAEPLAVAQDQLTRVQAEFSQEKKLLDEATQQQTAMEQKVVSLDAKIKQAQQAEVAATKDLTENGARIEKLATPGDEAKRLQAAQDELAAAQAEVARIEQKRQKLEAARAQLSAAATP